MMGEPLSRAPLTEFLSGLEPTGKRPLVGKEYHRPLIYVVKSLLLRVTRVFEHLAHEENNFRKNDVNNFNANCTKVVRVNQSIEL